MQDKWMQKAVPARNEGAFAAKARSHGMSVLEYAHAVMADPRAPLHLKHQAQFAINATHVAHGMLNRRGG